MKQILCSFVAALTLITVAHALDDAPENSAHAAILFHMDSGEVLYEKNADEPMLIASTTKILTALVTLENCELSEQATVSRAHCSVEGSSVYLKPGQRYSVEDLLYGLLLSSGNDAAMVLAEHVSGSVEAFSVLMNTTAQRIGMMNSHFSNPHGLDAEDHYSTARDLAVLTAEAMNNEDFARIVSAKTYELGETHCVNHNKLLWNYEGCKGVKTGYTMAAGRSLVSCAERNGMRLICVTLSDPDDWNDHTRLYDWAFSNFEMLHAVPNGTLASLPVISGSADTVRVAAVENSAILVPKGASVDVRLELPDFVYADVRAGTTAGTLVVLIDGKLAQRVELCFVESVSVQENMRLTAWERFKRALYLSTRYGGMGYYGVIY